MVHLEDFQQRGLSHTMLQAAIAAVGLTAAAVGYFQGQDAGNKADAAQGQITAASQRAEQLRAQQMRLENQRKQRDSIRQMIIARSTAVSNASSGGASLQSSGLQGAFGQITGLTGQNVLAQAQNTQNGEGIFSANQDRMNAELSLSRARTDQNNASALMSFGTSLVGNAPTLTSNLQSSGKQVANLFSGS